MLVRSVAVLATLAACYRQPARPAPAPGPGSSAAAAEAEGWPVSLEFEMAEREEKLARRGLPMFAVETRLPVFYSEPPAVAAALNARVARLASPALDPRTREGKYGLDCSVELANKYAVILDCEQTLDERTREQRAQATAEVEAPSRRLAIGWWLRRGLPDLSLEQFAPRLDVRALVEAAAASVTPGCALESCAFDPRSFVIDGDGLTLVTTGECPAECEGSIPSIPFDQLAPTHAWARELVKRVHRRVEAGEGLVEGAR